MKGKKRGRWISVRRNDKREVALAIQLLGWCASGKRMRTTKVKESKSEWEEKEKEKEKEESSSFVTVTSCARGCWWLQWRCSNIPHTKSTPHTTMMTTSSNTTVPHCIFNRTRAAITDDARARKAWHILSALADSAHLYKRRGTQHRATHVRYLERGRRSLLSPR